MRGDTGGCSLCNYFKGVASDAVVVLVVDGSQTRENSAAEFFVARLVVEALSFGTIGMWLLSRHYFSIGRQCLARRMITQAVHGVDVGRAGHALDLQS